MMLHNENSNKWINMFNKKFEEFIKDLILLYPNDADFKTMKSSFNMLKIVDEKKPIEMFMTYGNKYKEMVENKNESFFLQHDYKTELELVDTKNITDEIIGRLKTYWISTNDANKDTIWKYLQLLYKIIDKLNNI